MRCIIKQSGLRARLEKATNLKTPGHSICMQQPSSTDSLLPPIQCSLETSTHTDFPPYSYFHPSQALNGMENKRKQDMSISTMSSVYHHSSFPNTENNS